MQTNFTALEDRKSEIMKKGSSLTEFIESNKRLASIHEIEGKNIGDKYQNSERIPLWFLCMQKAQDIWLKLKSIVVKNMEWNRWKLWIWGIWRYRALIADFYIFKHEYILILKN